MDDVKQTKPMNESIAEAQEKKKMQKSQRLDKKIRAAGSYIVQKHLEAWKELAK